MLNRRTLMGAMGATALAGPSFGQAIADTIEVLDMTKGDADAPIHIIEYASFTCPHCAAFHRDVYPMIDAEYIQTGKAKFTLREVYFDRLGLWAGMLARCDGPEKYFGVVDILLNKQREWAAGTDAAVVSENLKRIGRSVGMEDAAVESCLQDRPMAEALVAEFQKNAEADSINSTPSFLINGEAYKNMSANEFRATLDGLL